MQEMSNTTVTKIMALDDFRKQVGIDLPWEMQEIEKIYFDEWYLDRFHLISIDDLGPVSIALRFCGANPNGQLFYMEVAISENLFFDTAFSLEAMIQGFLEDEVYLLQND